MNECQVCRIPLGHYEACPSPSCPCFGLRAGTAEAELAAERYRRRPSVAQARSMSGTAAVDHLDKLAWLAYMRAAGDLIDVEIQHRELP